MATTATTRDLVVRVSIDDFGSHLPTLELELSAGRSIELVRGETVIAEMHAPIRVAECSDIVERPVPDFMARLRNIYGDEVLPAGTTTKWIRDDRDGL